jgi:hypothetical protein
MLGFTSQSMAGSDAFTQVEVNVALLYNVTKFVQWPENSFSDPLAPLNLCTYTSEQYQAPLRALETRSVRKHPIRVQLLSAGVEPPAGDCHVLFFSSDGGAQFSDELRRVDGRAVLTVGDFREFTRRGGMLSLSRNRTRVSIDINMAVSQRAGLSYNAQLLELATVVDEGSEAGS